MNEHCLLNPTATSVKTATVFFYIQATFLFSSCHAYGCLYLTVLKLKSSHYATLYSKLCLLD